MRLENDFTVGVPPEEAWRMLTDVERMAPLLPGARLEEVEGDELRGRFRVKVGPITAHYEGKATFAERDEQAGRVVLKATGRDAHGQGNADALVTATLAPAADGTRVDVVTELNVTGKVAQFGRGVLADVGGKLLGQFVDALVADAGRGGAGDPDPTPRDGVPVLSLFDDSLPSSASPEPAPVGASVPTPAPAPPTGTPRTDAERRVASADRPGPARFGEPDPEPANRLVAGGGSLGSLPAPLLGGGLLLLVILFLVRRRRR